MERKRVPGCDSIDSFNSAIKGIKGIKIRPAPLLSEGMGWQKRKLVFEEKGARIVYEIGCRREPVC